MWVGEVERRNLIPFIRDTVSTDGCIGADNVLFEGDEVPNGGRFDRRQQSHRLQVQRLPAVVQYRIVAHGFEHICTGRQWMDVVVNDQSYLVLSGVLEA